MPTNPRVARDIFDCVRLKQRNVDNYQYDSICGNGRSDLFAADTNYLGRLKHLRLCLWDTQDSEQAIAVLDSMSKLTSLDMDLREVFYDKAVLPKLVFRALNTDRERSSIRSLSLEGIDFAYYSGTFPRLLEARNLKHLQLVYCHNYGPFLQMLTTLSLELATLTISEYDHGSGSFDDNADGFIRSLSSLERVSLTLDADFEHLHGLLDWSTLHKCALAVRSLKVQYHLVQPPYPSDKNVSDFRRFCQNASGLEQLSMSGIEVSMKETSGDKYIQGSLEQFLVSYHLTLLLKSVITDIRFQDCVQTASALVVLKLVVWVNFDTAPLSKDASIEAHVKEAQDMERRRELLVKSTADKIFSTLASACPKLKVVVIETAWQYGRDDSAVRAFLKTRQIDLYGHTTIVGVPVEPHMVKHYEPCSDILESDRFVFA